MACLTSACSPCFLEKRSAAGEAMKMEEYVPIRIPAEIVQAKSSMEGPPKKYRQTSTASVERDVSKVRESV